MLASLLTIVGVCVLLSAVVGSVRILEEDGVLILNEANFKEARRQYPVLLVDFYAKWCGHCSKIAPEYAKAANQLRREEPGIRLAMLEGSEERRVADKYNIDHFPTLLLFKDSHDQVILEYHGEGKAPAILNWVRIKLEPAATYTATLEALQSNIQLSTEVLFVGFFRDRNSSEARAYEGAAYHFNDLNFASTDLAEAFDAYKITASQHAVVAFQKFDEGRADYKGNFTVPTLVAFIASQRLPMVVDYSPEYSRLFQTERIKNFLFFIHSNKFDFEKVRPVFTTVAKTFRESVRVIACNIDKKDNSQIAEDLGVSQKDLPTYLVVESRSGELHKFRPADDGKDFNDAEKVNTFVKAAISGRILRHFNSDPLPQNWDKTSVKTLVGSNFQRVAYDLRKAVFVLFYATWCEFCKKVEPIWNELGEIYRNHPDIVIARINSASNEVEGLTIQSFPTFKYFPKGSSNIIEYKGEQSIDDFKKFLDSNGKDANSGHDSSDL